MNSQSKYAQEWNAQADQYNQWDALGEDEKLEWIKKCDSIREPAPIAAVMDVLAERQRQVEAEGFTGKHDDEVNDSGILAAAACAYTMYAADELHPQSQGDGNFSRNVPSFWPFDLSWWKPDDPRRALVKAGALILAEIERIDRAEKMKDQ